MALVGRRWLVGVVVGSGDGVLGVTDCVALILHVVL